MPTAEAQIAETMAGMRRAAADRGKLPAKKLAATVAILRQILAAIPDGLPGPAGLAGSADLAGLRDRALLLLGFAGALRRAELAAIRVEHLEARDRGLRLTLPRSKGERAGCSVTVAIPYGTTELCSVRALRRWQEAAGITAGPVFRRIFVPPRGRDGRQTPSPASASRRSIPAPSPTSSRPAPPPPASSGAPLAATACLKRGALTTGMERGVHPTRLKQLGRHKSYAVLDEYLELGDPFESHPLCGVL